MRTDKSILRKVHSNKILNMSNVIFTEFTSLLCTLLIILFSWIVCLCGVVIWNNSNLFQSYLIDIHCVKNGGSFSSLFSILRGVLRNTGFGLCAPLLTRYFHVNNQSILEMMVRLEAGILLAYSCKKTTQLRSSNSD